MAKRVNGAVDRIPVTPEMFQMVREFKRGANASYDLVLHIAFMRLMRKGETPAQAGERVMREIGEALR